MAWGAFPAFAFALVLGSALASCKSGGRASDSPNTLAHAHESWCPEGFESGPSDTCFAVPERSTKDTPIVVYLHGMYTGHGAPEEWAAVRIAVQRGFAVVIPRGKRGLCAWNAEAKDHYCWPSDAEDTPTNKGVIGEWDRVLWQVDALLESGTHRRYILGFSNGGFFAALVAAQGLFNASGYAIVNGGPLGPVGKGKPTPLLLISAADDKDQAPKMKELHDGLTKATWAHAYCPRPGAHPLTPDDVEASLRFFRRDVDGTLKVQGGLYACDGSAPRK